jgi:hypothetical protein
MQYKGSCHCGKVKFEVDGDIESLIECNCSSCSKKGFRWWFVPKTQFTLNSGDDSLSTYTFNKHVIQYKFCNNCGTTPFAFGMDAEGNQTAAINTRCLDNADITDIAIHQYDGRSA